MKYFAVKAINLFLIMAVLAGYNMTIEIHARQDDIAKLQAELAGSQSTVTDVKAEIKQLAADHAPSARPVEEQAAEEPEETEESGLTDGVYEGEAQGFGGAIAVSVSVEGGEITSVEVTSAEGEDPAYLEMAKSIAGTIVEAQSAEVDTVSGATFSSTGIRDAAALALEKAAE